MKTRAFVRETTVTCDKCGRTEVMVKRYSDADEAMRAAREAMNEKRREVLKWSQGSEEDQLDLCNTCAIRELIDKLRSAQQG